MNLATAERTTENRAVFEMEQREARAEAIAERASEIQLPGGECDPLDANNFGNAMAGADFTEVCELLRAGDDMAAGAAVRLISEKYQAERAPMIAEKRLNEEIERAKEDAAADAAEDVLYY